MKARRGCALGGRWPMLPNRGWRVRLNRVGEGMRWNISGGFNKNSRFLFPSARRRLATAVTRRRAVPFTADPITEANIIIAHLTAETKGARLP